MLQDRARFLVAPLWLLCCALSACSDDDDKERGPDITLPKFYDLPSAPTEIQTAAKAVVRLTTARYYGTGSFISENGLLLTNNHVLGETECPVEGCVVSVAVLHQIGEEPQDDQQYWATPVTFDAGLDIAILQLGPLDSDEPPLKTPSYLKFDEQTGEDLLGQRVTVVGHPEGALKKWSEGTVVEATGKWITTTNFILSGDSGSPILNDDGKIVGIVHRGPDDIDLISDEGVNVYTIGSPSAAIKAALNAPLPATAFSGTADTTEANALDYDSALLNAQQTTVSVAGTQVDLLDILGRACDLALNDKDYPSLEHLYSNLYPCFAAESWIDCRQDYATYPICPSDAERPLWRERFQTLNAIQMAMTGIVDYASIGPAIAQLENTYDEGVVAGTKSLQQVLDAASPTLNFELAYYLAMFEIADYDGTSVSAYITNYSKVPGYELGATSVAYAGSWLAGNRAISVPQLVTLLKSLMSDSKVDISAKLASESMLYSLGAL